MPQPVVPTELHAPQNRSCQSPGQSVGSCVWGHRANGSDKVIVIDENTAKKAAVASVDGVSFAGNSNDLRDGNCTIRVSNGTEYHFGRWSYMLITKN